MFWESRGFFTENSVKIPFAVTPVPLRLRREDRLIMRIDQDIFLGKGLARSRDGKEDRRKPSRYLLYAIPLIALLSIGVVYVFYLSPVPDSPAAMDYTFQMLIQLPARNQANSVQAYAPGHPIGETGGYWQSSQFNQYGVNPSHYPIYMDNPASVCTPVCTIHVKSTIVYNYTLGDFFNVWGQPLGQNNTIGQTSQGRFIWQMCLGASQPSTESTAWGALPLSPNLSITLNYYDSSGIPYCGAG